MFVSVRKGRESPLWRGKILERSGRRIQSYSTYLGLCVTCGQFIIKLSETLDQSMAWIQLNSVLTQGNL